MDTRAKCGAALLLSCGLAFSTRSEVVIDRLALDGLRVDLSRADLFTAADPDAAPGGAIGWLPRIDIENVAARGPGEPPRLRVFAESLRVRTLEHAEEGRVAVLAIRGFEIANPPGFDEGRFLHIERSVAATPLEALAAEPMRIATLVLSGVRVELERRRLERNYAVVLGAFAEIDAGLEAAASAAEGGIVVEELVLEDVTVRARLIGQDGRLATQEVHIESSRFLNVGGAEASSRIGTVITRSVLQAALTQSAFLPADIATDLAGSLGRFGLDLMRSPLRTTRGALQQSSEGIGDAVRRGRDLLGRAKDLLP